MSLPAGLAASLVVGIGVACKESQRASVSMRCRWATNAQGGPQGR